jgi:lipoprotein-releasing system permease protein
LNSVLTSLFILVGALAVDALALAALGWYRRRRGRPGRPAQSWDWRTMALALVVQAALYGSLWGLFVTFVRHVEGNTTTLLAGVAACSFMGGIVTAALRKQMRLLEQEAAVIIITEILWAAIYPTFAPQGIASPELRTLIVAPCAALLLAAAGNALAYLLWGSGKPDLQWAVERLIGWRFIRARKSRALSTVTWISVGGVSLGVALLIVSLAVLSGFENDLIEKIIGANAHVTVTTYPGYPIEDQAKIVTTVAADPAVTQVYPYAMGEVMVASETNIAYAMLFGVELESARTVINVFDTVTMGSADFLARGYRAAANTSPATSVLPGAPAVTVELPSILIGQEMLRMLNVEPGETLRVVSPLLEELTPAGVIPKSRTFKVRGIFDTRMYEYDAKFAYLRLEDAQAFFEIGKTVTAVGARVRDVTDVNGVSTRLLAALGGYPYRTFDWKKKNEALFASVELERVVAFIVLIFIVLVASFSIVNTLTLAVIEKGQAIAILKSMGASDLMVMKTFVLQGVIVGGIGTLVGFAGGIGLCQLLHRFGVWIDPEVYYIDTLPVHLNMSDALVVLVASLLITFIAAVYPSRMAERFSPVEGLRNG